MNKLKKAFLPVFTFARIDIKRLFRDKVGIFFVFVFPLIFLFVFGGLFGSDSSVSFKVGLINQSQSEVASSFAASLQDSDIINVDSEVTNLDIAREKMNRGQIDATIILPPNFGDVSADQAFPTGQAEILYDQNNEQAAQTLSSILEAMFTEMNQQFVQSETPFSVTSSSTATKGQSRFDYTFSGLLGFTILSLGIFGPTTVFPRLKEKGILRRYHTTTLRVWQYFTANVLSNAAIGLMAVALMFILATLFFNLTMRGDYVSLALWAIIGVALLFGIGLAVGGWAKNENQAAPLANIITFPMMFLSGVFFPVFLMPVWLQNITQFIPLTPVIDGFRLIITEGRTIFELGPQLAVIGIWIIAIYVIAFRVFRWE